MVVGACGSLFGRPAGTRTDPYEHRMLMESMSDYEMAAAAPTDEPAPAPASPHTHTLPALLI